MQVPIIPFIMQVRICILQILRQQRPLEGGYRDRGVGRRRVSRQWGRKEGIETGGSEGGYRDSGCIDKNPLNKILIKQLLAIFFYYFSYFSGCYDYAEHRARKRRCIK